ncbi:MAG: tRNA 4-thiouridine(8) synthase ThiI [Candidatus Omnitrophota bacterium]
MNKKAIALISGGLDSLLAAKIVQDQGVKVQGAAFLMQFASKDIKIFKRQIKKASDEAGIPVKFIDMSKEFLEVLKKPNYGYGANLNPCIDCKILMCKLAKNLMKKESAGFIVTGEVLGERPMSQRRDALNIIEKKSGLKGLLLRPLSAKLLEETVPEKEGIVGRDKLCALSGRGRDRQLAMAKKYGLTKFFAPSGGCLLTDSIFSKKLKDLILKKELTSENVSLLKYGRHFRVDEKTKAVVGRDQNDNENIFKLKKQTDVFLRFKTDPGPYVLMRGKKHAENIQKAAGLLIGHSKSRKKTNVAVEVQAGKKTKKIIKADPLDKVTIDKLRI